MPVETGAFPRVGHFSTRRSRDMYQSRAKRKVGRRWPASYCGIDGVPLMIPNEGAFFRGSRERLLHFCGTQPFAPVYALKNMLLLPRFGDLWCRQVLPEPGSLGQWADAIDEILDSEPVSCRFAHFGISSKHSPHRRRKTSLHSRCRAHWEPVFRKRFTQEHQFLREVGRQ